jgi:nitroreductase/NAD-dependent dihydropyrimidine dehydrogenase PreA subunit
MGLITIDESACKKDGMCARECLAAIIRLPEGGYPEIPEDNEIACRLCGHCVAVCPQGALSHEAVHIEDSPPLEKDLAIGEAQAVQFLRSRRSIRSYTEKPVERKTVQRLIEIARYAPTAGNSQLVEWVVISGNARVREIAAEAARCLREILDKDPSVAVAAPYLPTTLATFDAGYDSILRNAPVLLIASAPVEAINGMVDLTLALSYLDLVAPVMGLGTCWAGLLHRAMLYSKSFKESLGVPPAHRYHYPMMLGYPKVKFYRLPERKSPKITFT